METLINFIASLIDSIISLLIHLNISKKNARIIAYILLISKSTFVFLFMKDKRGIA